MPFPKPLPPSSILVCASASTLGSIPRTRSCVTRALPVLPGSVLMFFPSPQVVENMRACTSESSSGPRNTALGDGCGAAWYVRYVLFLESVHRFSCRLLLSSDCSELVHFHPARRTICICLGGSLVSSARSAATGDAPGMRHKA